MVRAEYLENVSGPTQLERRGGKAEQKEKSMVLPVETRSQGPRKSIKESGLHPEGPVSHRSVLNTLSFFSPLKLPLSNCF